MVILPSTSNNEDYSHKVRKTYAPNNHGDIVGLTDSPKFTPNFISSKRILSGKPTAPAVRPFSKKVSILKEKPEVKRTLMKIPKDVRRSSSISGDILSDPPLVPYKNAKKHIAQDDRQENILEFDPHAPTSPSKRRNSNVIPDHDEFFVYDPTAKGLKRPHSSIRVNITKPESTKDDVFGSLQFVDHILPSVHYTQSINKSIILHQVNDVKSPKGANITRSSSNMGNILKWDDGVDAAKPLRKESLKPSQLSNIQLNGFQKK